MILTVYIDTSSLDPESSLAKKMLALSRSHTTIEGCFFNLHEAYAEFCYLYDFHPPFIESNISKENIIKEKKEALRVACQDSLEIATNIAQDFSEDPAYHSIARKLESLIMHLRGSKIQLEFELKDMVNTLIHEKKTQRMRELCAFFEKRRERHAAKIDESTQIINFIINNTTEKTDKNIRRIKRRILKSEKSINLHIFRLYSYWMEHLKNCPPAIGDYSRYVLHLLLIEFSFIQADREKHIKLKQDIENYIASRGREEIRRSNAADSDSQESFNTTSSASVSRERQWVAWTDSSSPDPGLGTSQLDETRQAPVLIFSIGRTRPNHTPTPTPTPVPDPQMSFGPPSH